MRNTTSSTIALLGILTACGAGDDEASAGSGGSAASSSATATSGPGAGGGGGSGSCDLVTGIASMGAAIPGQALMLTAKDAGSGRSYTVAWSSASGAITPSMPSGHDASWAIDGALARDVAEKVTVTATASAMGCPDDMVTLDVTVDWTPALRTLVLFNSNAAAVGSKDVADYYATFRAIPADHECAVDYPSIESVNGAADYATLWTTVKACIDALGPYVQNIVPVYGVPITISGQVQDTFAQTPAPATVSLDSLLATGAMSPGVTGPVSNPLYFMGDSMTMSYGAWKSLGALRKSLGEDYYIVSRIDGKDAATAKALVDRTKQAEGLAKGGQLMGTVYVDGNEGLPHPATADFGSYAWGEWNIIGVDQIFTAYAKYPVVADYNGEEFGTAPAPLTCPTALYYAGWYSYNHYNDVFTWQPGAIGGHLDSCSACYLHNGGSWSGEAISKGITATFGAVGEPYVIGLPKYDQIFRYLLDGASFGEAAVQSIAFLGWMNQYIGDPLYRPYAK